MAALLACDSDAPTATSAQATPAPQAEMDPDLSYSLNAEMSASSFTLPFAGVANSDQAAFQVTQEGLGRSGYFRVYNTSSTSQAVMGYQRGRGQAGLFQIDNPAGPSAAVYGLTNGTGPAVQGYSTGTSWAGHFRVNNPNSNSPALYVTSNANGTQTYDTEATLYALSSGANSAGAFHSRGSSNHPGVMSFMHGSTAGAAFLGYVTGVGQGMSLDLRSWQNVQPALSVNTEGSGAALVARSASGPWAITATGGAAFLGVAERNGADALVIAHQGTSGNLAVFRRSTTNMVRFDMTGRGYFNGGTQTGGADLAEAFAVDGDRAAYQPGDVLVISIEHDRSVAKSAEPYSTLVAGVYATRPGVLLSERGIDESHDDLVPLGMVGVIPTKVSAENGPISRGDLLVTSSIPGHAMRGTDRERLLGAVIGKALEPFSGPGTGMIRVLVNVR
jgi:hypothetical protein